MFTLSPFFTVLVVNFPMAFFAASPRRRWETGGGGRLIHVQKDVDSWTYMQHVNHTAWALGLGHKETAVLWILLLSVWDIQSTTGVRRCDGLWFIFKHSHRPRLYSLFTADSVTESVTAGRWSEGWSAADGEGEEEEEEGGDRVLRGRLDYTEEGREGEEVTTHRSIKLSAEIHLIKY